MIVTCNCGIKLKVSDDKITDAGIKIRCPKCGTTHMVTKSLGDGQQAPAAAASAAPPSVSTTRAATSPRASGVPLVIIAHDSKAVADMIDGVLAEAGMRTDYAPNGLEALKKATELRPQAMIVDVGLTGIYGFELCERLKGDPGTRDIKIILLSSVYGLTAYKRAPVTLYGADDYIEKHHISDQLVPKLSRLLSGESAPGPAVPEASVSAAAPTAGIPEEPAPQQAFEPVNLSALQAQTFVARERIPAEPSPAPAAAGIDDPAMPEIPSILPTTPITLGTTRKPAMPSPPQAIPAAPVQNEPPAAAPRAAVPETKAAPPVRSAPAVDDASIKLDADFFEHEEYTAPEPKPKSTADPAEIEKARRFARIIVSDIALYNQEAVDEGIANDTFYDLLRDDITEGRQLYDTRVPSDIRATKDYLQEAFDDFIASQKKLR